MISILIVNWNGRRFLADCLRSIQEKVSVAYEVVLVDNASSDGSAELIAESYPWVKLVRSGDNVGFAAGNNLAARHATGEILMLLNMDTVLLADPAPMVEALSGDGTIGCIGAGMLNGAGAVVANCGHFPSPLRLLLFASMFWSPYKGSYGPASLGSQLVDWVEGSWMLMRREVWDKVGGFDERIFLYGEDVDICRGIADLGFKVVHVPAVAYRHYVGWSVRRLPLQFSSFRLYHQKHSAGLERVLAEGALFLGLKARLVCYSALGLLARSPRFQEKARVLGEIDRGWGSSGGMGQEGRDEAKQTLAVGSDAE